MIPKFIKLHLYNKNTPIFVNTNEIVSIMDVAKDPAVPVTEVRYGTSVAAVRETVDEIFTKIEAMYVHPGWCATPR